MGYESLKFIMLEQTKSSYATIKTILDEMSEEEYLKIPVFSLSKEQLDFVKQYAVCDIPSREVKNFCDKKPYFDLYYVAPTLFKVYNTNSKTDNQTSTQS